MFKSASLNTAAERLLDHMVKTQPAKAPEAPPAVPEVLNHQRLQSHTRLQHVAHGTSEALSWGSSGEDVKAVQQALQDLGFSIGDSVDGDYGPRTRAGLLNFQDNRGLPETGDIDAATLKALDKVATAPGKNLSDNASEAFYRDENLIPSNLLANGERAKVVIDRSEHRLFLFDGEDLQAVHSVATGNAHHADGRGAATAVGVNVVDGKLNDPSSVATQLWDNPGVFGTRLFNLSFVNLETGALSHSGHELHGTYNRSSIGKDASHGCIRMQNEAIESIFDTVHNGDYVNVVE